MLDNEGLLRAVGTSRIHKERATLCFASMSDNAPAPKAAV